MPVFFFYYSDVIVAVLSIFMFLAGTTCIALAREKAVDRPVPAWRSLGISMIAMAIRAWLAIFGISDPDFVSWYSLASLLQVIAGIFILDAARSEATAGGRRLTFIHAAAALLLVVGAVVLVEAYLSYGHRLDIGKPLISPTGFFLLKGLTSATALVFLYYAWRTPNRLPANIIAVPGLYAVMMILVFISLPPGLPSATIGINPTINMTVLVVFLLRTAIALAMAVLLWNAYARAVGVMGQNRWWPLMIVLFMVMTSVVFILISTENYRGMVRRNLISATRDAATALPPDALLEAAATRGSTNDPQMARRLFQQVRQLESFASEVDLHIQVDALAFPPGTDAAVPLIDAIRHPNGGAWAQGDLRKLRREVEEKGLAVRDNGFEPILILAPLPKEDAGPPGAAALSVSVFALALDLYKFKSLFLILLPPAFLLLTLIISGQQRAWLDRHSLLRFEAMRLGALGSDLTGVLITRGTAIVDLNQRCSNILGVAKDELLGRNIGDVLPAIDPERIGPEGESRAGFPDAAATLETSARRSDGASVNLLVLGRRLPIANGGYYFWECVDVTSLKNMESEIRVARDRLQTIVDSLPIGVFVKDSRGIYLLANNTFASLAGFSKGEEIIGKPGIALGGADPDFIRAQDEICVDMQGATLAYDQKLHFKDGERYYEISKTLKWLGDDRSNYFIVGSAHDFTARQKAQNAIQAERHFLRQLIDTLPLAVCFLDRDRVIRLCDADFCAEAGAAAPGDLVGKLYSDVAPYGHNRPEEDIRLLARGRGSEDVEFELDKNGRKRNFFMRRTVMSSTDGEVVGLVKAFSDTTELVAANRAAKKADRAKAAFLTNTSHELRTPMNGIVGMADLIIDHTAQPMLRLYGEIIIKSAKTLQMVMDEIMDTAAIEDDASRFALSTAPFALLNVVEETTQIASCIIEAWGVELSMHYDFSIHGVYVGDARQIRQIIAQILTHCARSTDDKRIRLEISEDAPGAGDDVRIDAIFKPVDGMNADALEELFKSTAGADSGGVLNLGMFNRRIGLPLAWRLIRAMNGSLSVTETEGRLHCRVRLPLPRAGAEQLPSLAGPPNLSNLRIVVATPDSSRARSIVSYLDYAGARTALAATWTEIMEALAQREPALLVLDSQIAPNSELPALLNEINGLVPTQKTPIVLVIPPRRVQSLGDVGTQIRSLLVPPICPRELWAKADAAVHRRAETDRRDKRDKSPAERPEHQERYPVPIDADVLLVEDNTVNQMVAMGILRRLGCRATLAKNGAEAVELLEGGGAFDVIFMDCMMPVMDGYEATSRIRRREGNTPGAKRNVVVALTANTVAGDREKCLAAGMDDYITKPVTLELMRAALRKHRPDLAGGVA